MGQALDAGKLGGVSCWWEGVMGAPLMPCVKHGQTVTVAEPVQFGDPVFPETPTTRILQYFCGNSLQITHYGNGAYSYGK